ncbi:polycomb protein SUZ12 [Diaphorina citri]|uniref:Polycomb protein SUZ12 n=1 Tax=Diaphorina citri TaxID=121845 RepID=A0A3Q0IZX1_DIACI|nr:polycomb protein SUZ12 [Diaphorina citri]
MPPKKSKEVDVSNTTQQTSDHELFLQAFEKPTQIYRYLKTRLVNTPIFLNRNLTYLKHRMSRTHAARKTFTVDSMLDKIKAKQFNQAKSSKEYLTVSYIGYFDKNAEFSEDQVKVDTMLLKLCHKKRKDVKCPVFTENIGTSYISINPEEDSTVPKVLNTLNISSDKFNVNSNYTVKSYHLIISVVREETSNLPVLDSNTSNALSINNNSSSSKTHLGASIVIFDKAKTPLLEGEYEIQLESYNGLLSASQNNNAAHFAADFSAASWETLDKVEDVNGLPSSTKPASLEPPTQGSGSASSTTVHSGHSTSLAHSTSHSGEGSKPIKVVYQFVYNNNSRQQTTACDDFKCPWCRLDCRFLYSLVKHLRYCHPRFKFTYHPMLNGALIDVAINSAFNKGYLGAPHHLIDQPSASLNLDTACTSYRKQPRQRCIGKEISYNLGKKLYHHTITCLPVLPKEMDQDSDDQKDPKWLQTKTKMMIDEFTDVNEGEKELMKLWNLHVMKYGFVGDCQIPLACSMFLENNGKELLRRNLYRNFVLHLCNMYDFGLLSGLAVYTTLQRLQSLILHEGDASSEFSQVLKSSCEAQRRYWIQEGSKRAPKLLEIRPPLASPTGDGVRRKPAGNSFFFLSFK